MFAGFYGGIQPRKTTLDTYVPPVERVRDRIAFGAKTEEDAITAAGAVAWIDTMLGYAHDTATATVKRTQLTWPTGFTETDYPSTYYLYPQETNIARIVGRQDAIRGMMVEFWLNHFVPGNQGDSTPEWFPSYLSLQEYFFVHALGSVKKLGTRFLKSVPLQHFMTNYLNTKTSKNENLGREFLELFFVGLADPNEPPRYDPIFDVLAVTDIMTGHGVRIAPSASVFDSDPNYRQGLINQAGNGLQTFYKDDWTVLAGGSVGFYEPGTLTPKAVYNLKVAPRSPITNPVTLNGSGQATIYGDGLYRIIGKDASNNTVFDFNTRGWAGNFHESFWFLAANHEEDPVTVTYLPGVEFSNAEDGAGADGPDNHPSLTKLIELTLRTRASARFFCTKLATFFLGTAPTALTREAMINTYLDNHDEDDQIAKVLRVLFLSKDFCTSYCDNARTLTPLMWYSKISAIFGDNLPQSTGYKILNRIQSYASVDEGYKTGIYQTPAGYPDVPAQWISPGALTGRAANTLTMMGTAVTNTSNYGTDPRFLFTTPQSCLDYFNTYLCGGRLNSGALTAIGAAFTTRNMPLANVVANWGAANPRAAVREVINAMAMLDVAHLAR
jgi:uncharacterized protein (DUF1800 family)